LSQIRSGGNRGVRLSLGGEETSGLAQSVAPKLFPRAPAGDLPAAAPGWLIFLVNYEGYEELEVLWSLTLFQTA